MEIPQQWDAYPTQVQNEFVMIVVNLGLDEVAPLADFPILMWLKVDFEPREGVIMPAEADREFLTAAEEELGRWADESDLILAGRLTGAGRREFFVYADTDRSEALRLRLENTFPGRQFDVRASRDEAWQLYREFLYPEPVAMQRIKNQRLVATLKEHDAAIETPRTVKHEALFHTEEAANAFAEHLSRARFSEVEVWETDDDERPFGVRGAKIHPVDLGSVDQVSIPLFTRIRELGGAYQGWVCPVVESR